MTSTNTTRPALRLGHLTLLLCCACAGSADDGPGASGEPLPTSALLATHFGGDDADAGSEPDAAAPTCVSKPSQVVVLGDSYVSWVSHTFPDDLAREAGETWRLYAIGGTALGSGGIGLIPDQLTQALAEDDDIVTIVMTGGGNDILVPDLMWPAGGNCKSDRNAANVKVCQDIVATALESGAAMLDDAAAHGIRDVLYFFYPRVPEPTLIGGWSPNAMLDYALPLAKEFCDGAAARTGGALRCHFVDMVPVFDGHPDWFAPTDIHPNTRGSAAMAKAVWDEMKRSCIGQPESSGCCVP